MKQLFVLQGDHAHSSAPANRQLPATRAINHGRYISAKPTTKITGEPKNIIFGNTWIQLSNTRWRQSSDGGTTGRAGADLGDS